MVIYLKDLGHGNLEHLLHRVANKSHHKNKMSRVMNLGRQKSSITKNQPLVHKKYHNLTILTSKNLVMLDGLKLQST